MAKDWDSLVKLLAEASPQELVSFVLPGATYKGETFTDLPAQSREIQADVMYNVVWEGIEVKRRFAMLHDILESSWAYQEMVQEASEKALEKGLEQGLEKGLEQGLQLGRQKALQQDRQVLTTYAEKHFPALVPLLKKQIDATDDPEVLQHLLIDLFNVDDKEEAERTILNSFVLPE